MDNDDRNGLLEACGCDRYPPGFLADYEPFECLAENEACETLLVKNKRTGMFYVAKCYPGGSAAGHAAEAEILKRLQHTGLPRFVDEYKSDEMLCVIREYVEGTPLHQLPALPAGRQAVSIAMQLCELMGYLHGQTPPVIHRDIKPQNLILGMDGQLWLIDFGISRLYREESETDTACWGTQDFAAPEQYGYAQTDVRSDIYSFGILLLWLLTGETKREAGLAKVADRRLKRIAARCTAFSPRERYASAAKVRADLAALDGGRRRQTVFRLGVAALCVLCLLAGFALGRYTQVLAPGARGAVFAEPLLGQAVRLMLGKSEGEAITASDLLSVTALYIYGDQPAQNAAAYQALVWQGSMETAAANGGIASLVDVAQLPNLDTLCLSRQNIADLTPLLKLAALRSLDLRHNPVADLTLLAQCGQLTEVCLYDTRAADLAPLAACTLLTTLDVGNTFVTSVAALAECASLQRLWLDRVPLQTLAGIGGLENLREIKLSQVADGDLTPLRSLPRLQTVLLSEALRPAAEAALAGAAFTVTYGLE